MTATEQADILVEEYKKSLNLHTSNYFKSRDCAIIAVQHILKLTGMPMYQSVYWNEVMAELQNHTNVKELNEK